MTMFIYDEIGSITHAMFFGGGGGNAPQAQETADQVAQAEINTKLWDYYQTSYRPLIDKYAQKVTNPEVKAEEESKVAGQINAEVMKNVDPSMAKTNPVQNTKQLNQLATVGSGAQVQGQGGVRSKQIKDTQNIIDIGRGQPTEAVAGLGDLASQSLSAEIADIELQNQQQAATENAYGSMAGAVAGGLLHKKRTLMADPYASIRQPTDLGISGSSMYGV